AKSSQVADFAGQLLLAKIVVANDVLQGLAHLLHRIGRKALRPGRSRPPASHKDRAQERPRPSMMKAGQDAHGLSSLHMGIGRPEHSNEVSMARSVDSRSLNYSLGSSQRPV